MKYQEVVKVMTVREGKRMSVEWKTSASRELADTIILVERRYGRPIPLMATVSCVDKRIHLCAHCRVHCDFATWLCSLRFRERWCCRELDLQVLIQTHLLRTVAFNSACIQSCKCQRGEGTGFHSRYPCLGRWFPCGVSTILPRGYLKADKFSFTC